MHQTPYFIRRYKWALESAATYRNFIKGMRSLYDKVYSALSHIVIYAFHIYHLGAIFLFMAFESIIKLKKALLKNRKVSSYLWSFCDYNSV